MRGDDYPLGAGPGGRYHCRACENGWDQIRWETCRRCGGTMIEPEPDPVIYPRARLGYAWRELCFLIWACRLRLVIALAGFGLGVLIGVKIAEALGVAPWIDYR